MLTLTFALIVGAACLGLTLTAGLILALVGLPLAILWGLLPWLLRLAAVVLLLKGLLDQPFRWENLTPAAAALVLSVLLGWIN